MLSCEDINKIINSPEKENITIELKSFRKLFKDERKTAIEKRKDIAYTIAAFANRFGGKLIFGLNDNGTFDGKNKFNIDEVKGIINQICSINISPIIDYQAQFLECTDGDLLIIHIPKRKGIPHAYIDSKNSTGEICKRVYYIKTHHGKQMVSDSQLAWLFNNQNDPKFDYKFRIALEFNKNFDLLNLITDQWSREVYWFMPYILKEDISRFKSDSTFFYTFFIQLFPYFVLKSFSDFFSQSWYIHISKGFDRMSSGPINSNSIINSCPVRIENIPTPDKSILFDFSWNFNQILNDLFKDNFHLPPESTLSIFYENENRISGFLIKNPKFSIKMNFAMLSAGSGMHQRNPYYEALLSQDIYKGHDFSMHNFFHLDAVGYLEASFDYPEYDMDEFDKYHHYYQTIKELLDYNWNYDLLLKKLPSKDIIILNDKLDKLLKRDSEK